ncbi:MAG: sigma-70 family RNA polymerase sigma factor [Isosphaeraceae bacterium]
MAIGRAGSSNGGGLGPIRTLYSIGSVAGLADACLLDRFRDGPRELSERAFEAIVSRHGPMVLGVCRRALSDPNDVEDAFQATFLVLARRSGSVRGASLGRWLYGVARKVAWRARLDAMRRPVPSGDRVDAWEGRTTSIDELGPVLDEEIGRLPAPYGEAVRLCLLEGLALKEAADRLGCRVGTVGSRLNRARGILRHRLIRRGFASPAALAAIETGPAPSELPESCAAATARLVLSGVGASVASLATQATGGLFMSKGMQAASALLVGLVGLGTGAAVLGHGDPPRAEAQAAGSSKDDPKPAAKPSVADQLRQILAEYEAAQKRCTEASEAAATEEESSRIYSQMAPNDAEFSRRIVDLVMTDPKTPASRDALVWVLDKPYRSDEGAYGDQFGRAARLLVDHHADDPDAVRVSLNLSGNGILSYHRDNLLNGFYIGAESREAKGLIRLAMGPYLEAKAKVAKALRNVPVKKNPPFRFEARGADGKLATFTQTRPNSEDGYRTGLRFYDADFLLAEAERMYEEVIAEYGDIPFLRTQDRKLAAALAEPVPAWNNKPMSAGEIAKLRERIDHPRTMGEVAAARLDEMHNLAVGKPAPEIDAADIDGKPMKLSDYRGKVVALVFWGSWCGPCMAEVPHERELVARYQGRPFALLGVNCNEPVEAARKAIADNGMSWPQWHDGEDQGGPIVSRYHVRAYPTILVIDGQGIIRRKDARGESLDRAVDELIKEIESPQP